VFLFGSYCGNAQNNNKKSKKIKLGFNYGFGKQESFPLNSNDYTYDVQFYKIQINYKLSEKRKWRFEINIEPGVYINEHQLLNKFYVQPRHGDDYLNKRLEYTAKKQINEYVLNLGFIARHLTFKNLSTYVLGSIGPMYLDTDTERMDSGLAFSDIIALGLSYQIKDIFLDFRYSMRHVSNANLSLPNNGLNSMNVELGFAYQL
jgi:hypothetical protein